MHALVDGKEVFVFIQNLLELTLLILGSIGRRIRKVRPNSKRRQRGIVGSGHVKVVPKEQSGLKTAFGWINIFIYSLHFLQQGNRLYFLVLCCCCFHMEWLFMIWSIGFHHNLTWMQSLECNHSYNGIHSSVNYRMRTILRFLLLSTFLVSCLSAPKFHLVEIEDEGEEEEEYHSFEFEDWDGSSQEDSLEEEKSADYRWGLGQDSQQDYLYKSCCHKNTPVQQLKSMSSFQRLNQGCPYITHRVWRSNLKQKRIVATNLGNSDWMTDGRPIMMLPIDSMINLDQTRFPNGQGSPGWPNGGPKGLPPPQGGAGVPQCPNCV